MPADRQRLGYGRRLAVAASLGVHLAILALLGLATPDLRASLRTTDPSVMEVRLEPEHRPHRTGPPAAPSADADQGAISSGQVREPFQPAFRAASAEPAAERSAPPTSVAQAESAPAPPSGASGLGSAGATRSSGASRLSGALGRDALRSFGRAARDCEAAVDLTRVERERCNERLGAAARTAPTFDAMDIRKRVAFDAAAERSRKCRFYETPVPMDAEHDRNESIRLPEQLLESQKKPSTAVTPPRFSLFSMACPP